MYRCTICNMSFPGLPELSDHQRVFHSLQARGDKLTKPADTKQDTSEDTIEQPLHLRVLAAILDQRTTREEAFELMEKVRDLS